MLARSGNTGMTEQPHLHFAVVDHKNQSVPIDFAEAPARLLAVGARPLSRNGQPPPSELPHDVFLANGIELVGELPPLPWRGRALLISGRARGDEVVAFLLDRATHEVVRQSSSAANVDGTFAFTLDLAGLDGLYDFAMAVPSPAGTFSSDFSIPVVVRPDVALSFGVVP
ncbi:MAG TPA: hypothetical protein VLC93_07025, partial [Myxococcota bacterium]|nr:hypothetical protein [Myxococcota bacterium]